MEQMKDIEYKDHLVGFIDLLGFAEVSAKDDEKTRLRILAFLASLAQFRGEFDIQSTPTQSGGTSTQVRPAVSTFSDHIVISFPLEEVWSGLGSSTAALFTLIQFNELLGRIASAALAIGFLIRGGVTIGKLYHSNGVIFGEGLIEAHELESRSAFYPRVVFSPKLFNDTDWVKHHANSLRRSKDGLLYFDYFSRIIISGVPPGNHWGEDVKAWFKAAIQIVAENLKKLEATGKLTELAKWSWFAYELREALERLPAGLQEGIGLSLEDIPWAREPKVL